MSGSVTALYGYPVKGLSAVPLTSVVLEPGLGIPGDRRFAIIHANSQYNVDAPGWVPRRNFVVLAHTPALAALQSCYDSSNRTITLSHRLPEQPSHSAEASVVLHVDDPCVHKELNNALLAFASTKQPGPFRLVECTAGSLTDSPDASVSIMNTKSLADFAQRADIPIDQARFRGNLWYNGEQPWEERSLIGQVIRVGSVTLKVTEEIVRCAALNVNPYRGGFDQQVLTQLGRHYGHSNFGVLASVISHGRISCGDVLNTVADNGPATLGL